MGGNVPKRVIIPNAPRSALPRTPVSPDLWHYEKLTARNGFRCVAGVDEAGRGPLAGPVVAAAVILAPPLHKSLRGLNDSKLLTEAARDQFFAALTEQLKVPFGIGVVSHEMIDQINIHQATHLAVQQALDALPIPPDHVLVDGLRGRTLKIPYTVIVGGDGLSYSIAAASVIAKVTRDRLMRELHKEFPQYNFAQHKGYGTVEHIALLKQHGYSPVHRRSFKPSALA